MLKRALRHALPALLVALTAAPATAAAAPAVGVNTHVLWGDVTEAARDRQLDLAKDAGSRIIRVDVGWGSLEQRGKGQYEAWYLKKLDGLVAAARARGLELLLTLNDSPCWASTAPESLKLGCTGSWWNRGVQRYAPQDPQDYADAFAFLVARYGSQVRAWETWNEPNSSFYFKAEDPVAADAALIRAAFKAAKAVRPDAYVVAGGLMDADAEFLRGLYAHGIKGHFDAISIHPYTGDASPLDPVTDRWIKLSYVRGVPDVRREMLAHGDDKPLWLTEFGWSTSTVRGTDQRWMNGVDEATQAKFTETAVRQLAAWPYVEAAMAYTLVDRGTDAASLIDNYGLVRADGTKKPVFAAFRAAADAVHAGTPAPAAVAPQGGSSSRTTGSARRTKAAAAKTAVRCTRTTKARTAKGRRLRAARVAACARAARAAAKKRRLLARR